jgi:hypothetical protein
MSGRSVPLKKDFDAVQDNELTGWVVKAAQRREANGD